MTSQEINSLIEKKHQDEAQKLEAQMTEIQNKLNLIKSNNSVQYTDAIVSALEKAHLQVSNFYYLMNKISISAISPNNKFRFITDKGYTSGGGGVNDRQLQAKADKLQDKLSAAIGKKVLVNKFSLELSEANVVLIDIIL